MINLLVNRPALIIILVGVILVGGLANAADTKVDGPYLGQKPPGLRPQIFAPGFLSKPDRHEFALVFSKDGRTCFFGVSKPDGHEIWMTRLSEGGWQEPRILFQQPEVNFHDPFLSLNEQRLYFISNRDSSGKAVAPHSDIWYSHRNGDAWSTPVALEPGINSSANEFYISFTKSGALYFASNVAASPKRKGDYDIYKAVLTGDGYEKPERLGVAVNSGGYEADPYIAPDESYLIFCAIRRTGLGEGDLYISFRGQDGQWLPAKNMGTGINSEGHELCPFVTRDGRYFFYTSNQDIYWVDAKILESLR